MYQLCGNWYFRYPIQETVVLNARFYDYFPTVSRSSNCIWYIVQYSTVQYSKVEWNIYYIWYSRTVV